MTLFIKEMVVIAVVSATVVAVAVGGEMSRDPEPDEVRRTIAIEKEWAGVPGLAVAVTREGRLLYQSATGYANVELRAPMTPSTVVQLSSTSKMFTGVAALTLVAQGALDLDVPASRYLSDLPVAWQAVTVRQLLTHTSGLPDILGCEGGTRQEALACVSALPVVSAPGYRFAYNQTNYFLLLEILERQTGEPFPVLMRRRLFSPAGMVSAVYAGSHRDVVRGRATSYYPAGAGGLQLREFDFPEFLYSAAGLNASLEDLLRFDRALFGGRLVPAADLSLLWSEPELNDGTRSSYGLGWDVKYHHAGRVSAGHEGGRLTTVRRFLDAELTVVVLANGSSDPFDPDRLAVLIAEVFVPGTATPGEGLAFRMREALEGGGVKDAVETHHRFAEEPGHASDDIEEPLNRLGYELLDRRRPADAVEVLRLNVARYPDSANAHDSLGEALAALGQEADAIAHYRESLRLDPSNDNARGMIERLRR